MTRFLPLISLFEPSDKTVHRSTAFYYQHLIAYTHCTSTGRQLTDKHIDKHTIHTQTASFHSCIHLAANPDPTAYRQDRIRNPTSTLFVTRPLWLKPFIQT